MEAQALLFPELGTVYWDFTAKGNSYGCSGVKKFEMILVRDNEEERWRMFMSVSGTEEKETRIVTLK